MPRTDVLIFAEDPGAANYLAQLPAALSARGVRARFFADGSAKDYLLQRKIDVEPGPRPESPGLMLASVNPRLLIVGTSDNPDTLGLALVEQARAMGIKSVGTVDARANAEHRFRGRGAHPLAYAPDWLLVPDEWTKDAFVALGYSTTRVIICGHPHYDQVHDAALRLARKDRSVLRRNIFPGASDRQILVFAAETATGLGPKQYRWSPDYTLTGRGGSTGRTEIVIEELLDALRDTKHSPYLVLRLHPKNRREEFARYLNEFDYVSKEEPPLEVVYAADLLVGMASIILVESCLMNRPTLSVVPRSQEAEWLPNVGTGISRVTTREQLRLALDLLLSTPPEAERVRNNPVIIGSLNHTVEAVEKLLAC